MSIVKFAAFFGKPIVKFAEFFGKSIVKFVEKCLKMLNFSDLQKLALRANLAYAAKNIRAANSRRGNFAIYGVSPPNYFLKYLLYSPWKPQPWRASSFAISWTVSWTAS